MNEIRFSVCVPVLNGAKSLAALLEGVRSQTHPALEIIVADGGSTDGTLQVLEQYPEVWVLPNPGVHASGGRSVAIAASSGTWCAFTDDDCVPDPGWLAAIAAAVHDYPDTVGVGGRVLPLPPRSLVEEVSAEAFLDKVLQFDDQPGVVGHHGLRHAPITANAAYRRDVLIDVGSFDPRFANYAEDIDLFLRIMRASLGQVRYVPSAIVHAEHPATVPDLVRKWRQYGMASSYLQRYHFGRFNLDRTLYAALGRNLVASLRGERRARQRAILEALQIISHLTGKWAGSLRTGVVNL